ncbi:sulfite exporter TauE/SafE family protein [Isoptericola sp. b441]|uniref:Probable membrane transporter protein n=1 Tax=Actinotalea lenta TaxID=3064654 RepID=A0ABT9D7Z7_9CELL|nr:MULTISPECIES: sulfite exporter TauE/SafE family protein [unclassified Isoptericola]MDO8106999.1 sulfite exporter TauE/SafE family protein [Isoptericola sp. b441]MDO8121291.1 sulfite exporter TauE/SafE family protein [Isoptericola sp. b490]
MPPSSSDVSWMRRWGVMVVVGALGGLISGAFGVGGGIVVVPLLVALAKMDQRTAAATSLAAIVPTALAGAVTYLSRGQADLVIAALLAVGGVAGSWLGVHLLHRLPLHVLRWMFVGLLVLVAARMVTAIPSRGSELSLTVPTLLLFLAIGLVMGLTAGLFGVGGGIVVVPALVVLVGVGDLLAKGTSLLVMVPTTLAGTFANVRRGMVDLRAALLVGVSATAASFAGVYIAFVIPARLSSVLFAALVLLTAAQMAWREIRQARPPRPEAEPAT